MRRVLAVLIGAGVAAGGGAAAWAGTAGADPAKREAARACLSQAREATPDADRAALRDVVKACMTEAGFEGRTARPERAAARACVAAARSANPDDKVATRAAARACLEEAGITPGRLRAKVAGARECLGEVRGANPGASRAELRDLVKECVAAK